jgi:hypothetical protein
MWQMFSTIKCQDLSTPPPRIICQIDGNDLSCDANYTSFNITAEIEYLSQTLPQNEKNFENLIIQRTSIEEIPENVFQDISFNFVQIFDAENLKRIHTNAFNNNTAYNLRKQFYISSPNQLRNDPPDYNFWKAFSSLVYIKDLEISLADGSHEIPDNAFEPINGPQNDLMFIVFDKNNFDISRIGSNAFSEIPNLMSLSFHDIPIGNISTNAFDFKNSSTQTLGINLINCGLSETSLEEGVFSDAKRPLILDLSMNFKLFINSEILKDFIFKIGRNNIILIEESKFGQFFKNDIQNAIILSGNLLDCDNLESFLWLLNQKPDLEFRVQYAECANGTDFWDLNPNNTISTTTTMQSTITTPHDNENTSATTNDPNNYSNSLFNANIFILLLTSITIYKNFLF